MPLTKVLQNAPNDQVDRIIQEFKEAGATSVVPSPNGDGTTTNIKVTIVGPAQRDDAAFRRR
jgi:hypothetical protein